MLVRNTLVRILKFLGKVIAGLLLVLFLIILLIHLPPVQNKITHKLSDFLSSKTESKIDIEKIRFSLLGIVTLENLEIRDPDSNKIFSVGKVEATSNFFDLLGGNYIFDEIRIEGVTSKLIQRDDGLNIQFLLDAFRPKETQAATPASAKVKFLFRKIILENIAFQFTSDVTGMDISTNLGQLTCQDVEYSSSQNKINVGKISLQKTMLNIISIQQPVDTIIMVEAKSQPGFSPDFGMGLGLDISDIDVKDCDFSYHVNDVITTPKFDPSHIDLKGLQLNISDIFVHEDELTAILKTLTVQMPGFKISDAGADLKLNRDRFVISKFHIASDTNEVNADLTGWYDGVPVDNDDFPNMEITAKCRIHPNDFAYFFNDTIINYFNKWKSTELSLACTYAQGKGEIKNLELKTANSEIIAAGIFNDIWDPEKFCWNDIAIQTSVGSDFQKILIPFMGNINLPPDMQLQVNCSGNRKKISIDGGANTSWGLIKAKGVVVKSTNNYKIDMNMTGKNFSPGKWMEYPWLGSVDMSAEAKGIIGHDQDLEFKGVINSIVIQEETIHNIDFHGNVGKKNLITSLSIRDTLYQSRIHSEISLAGPLLARNEIQFTDFRIGRLLHRDSTTIISGDFSSTLKMDQPSIDCSVEGRSISIQKQKRPYALDTLSIIALISPSKSDFEIKADDSKGNLTANFDIRELQSIFHTWSMNILQDSIDFTLPAGSRILTYDFHFEKASLLQLLGIDVDEYSSLSISGNLDAQKQAATLQATTGKFKGYGISLDTIHATIAALHDSITTHMNVVNLFYDTIQIGNLDFEMATTGDTIRSDLLLTRDSFSLLGLRARVLRNGNGVFIYPDMVTAFDNEYHPGWNNPIWVKNSNVTMDHFVLASGDMQMNLNGDLDTFDVNFTNLNLTNLNSLLRSDSMIIDKGLMSGTFIYSRDKRLDLNAHIDSLILYNSIPISVSLKAVKNENQVPFEFLLSNSSNNVDINGKYSLDTKEVDGTMQLDVNNLELFKYLLSGTLDDLHGACKGEAKFLGPIQKPVVNGYIRFVDASFTTSEPKLTFNVHDDTIRMDNSGISVANFTIYDQGHHPLVITGNFVTKDLPAYTYDFKINADKYALIDKPHDSKDQLKGFLVIGSDIKLSGNEKDTYVKADIDILDTTSLVFVLANDNSELLNTEDIVEFVDPASFHDSTYLDHNQNYYDSLIASLPDFNLNSKIKIEKNAKLTIIIDAQSGDYFETSGGADLEMSYDRTGNVQLSGIYTINKGVYRVSFYDLVKKNFNLVPGSSIHWSGSPENGEMDIKAVHTVESNSIGLVGHEVGENEQSIYKKSLDYEVGINIKGTVEKPIVSFSLDLPENEKVNYPVLANKLDRLKQPEFQSELNKQVFGLLVLGGFIPETNSSDINQNVIATTAITNSVNSLLAAQLNRFAGQYIKGVTIDVGIQSYADYSTPGGETKTAMDFRVTKSVMNDRLSFEVGGDFDINADQSGANTGNNYRGDVAIIYDLTGNGDKKLKLFNNETYDIIYQEIRNTGISLIFIREFDKDDKNKNKNK